MIRLIAIDIDGTLLDSRGRLPDAHRDAIVDAHARGLEIALVTGRSFHFTRPIATLLPIPLTLVCNNGALVKDKSGATAMRRLLARDTARHVLSATAEYEDSVAIIFDRIPSLGAGPSSSLGAGPADSADAGAAGSIDDNERQIVFERMDWSHPHRSGYFEKNKAFIARAPGPLADVLIEDPVQVMFNGSVGPMRALFSALRSMPAADRFSVALTEYEPRDFSLVDVNAAGCSKGTTLAQWAERRGLSRDEVMAVGDNLNDVEMLDFAGTAVVMGNATDALKARGYRVTGTNDEGGLATAISAHAGNRHGGRSGSERKTR
ncbi:MAG TPA: HAD-IIB family hydrolase [Vicinamibacterales bacterium]|jgi:hypothetical protein|nr:HAD-IIB family hydrolase [Vicinamibacterales bacterium]